MKIIYFVVACIFAAISWVCTQIAWQYSNILLYIALFITSFYLCLVFLYQEENETSKKYTIFTPYNLAYVIIIAVILFTLRKYNIKEYTTIKYSFYKVIAIVNAIQGAIIMFYFKIRDIYYHM